MRHFLDTYVSILMLGGDNVKVIICVEKSNGMLFNNRRHSKDSVLQQKIFELIGQKELLVNEYTAGQFATAEGLKVCQNFLEIAKEDDYCFVEKEDIPIDKVSELLIFRWNRAYPSDVYFSYDLASLGFKRIKKKEFAGSSHKRITLEIYRREN